MMPGSEGRVPVATPEGFEPPTYGLGIRRSILLSYGAAVCGLQQLDTRYNGTRAQPSSVRLPPGFAPKIPATREP